MARLRRYFVPALLLAPVVLACGKLLLTNVQPERLALQFDQAAVANDTYEQGWPWVFRFSPVPNGATGSEPGSFFPWLLVADLAVLAVLIAFASWLIYWHRRRHNHWLQLSLKASFVVIALCGIAFGWWHYERRQYEREQAVVKEKGDDFWLVTHTMYCGPEWLRRLMPGIDQRESIFKRVIAVHQVVPSGPPVRILQLLQDFPRTRALLITRKGGVWILDDDMFSGNRKKLPPEDLSEFDQVECVMLQFFNDAEPLESICTLPRLRSLQCSSFVTGTGFSLITKCSRLEVLALDQCHITDQEFAQLSNLTQLCGLKLKQLRITDSSVDTLLKLAKLRELDLDVDPPVDSGDNFAVFSDASVRRLIAMPQLRELHLSSISDQARDFVDEFNDRREQP